MSELIRRLRDRAVLHGAGPDATLYWAAANEIERLMDDLATSERLREHATRELGKDCAEIERLRDLVRRLAMAGNSGGIAWMPVFEDARRLLEGTNPQG
jgi:hypothetical protein